MSYDFDSYIREADEQASVDFDSYINEAENNERFKLGLPPMAMGGSRNVVKDKPKAPKERKRPERKPSPEPEVVAGQGGRRKERPTNPAQGRPLSIDEQREMVKIADEHRQELESLAGIEHAPSRKEWDAIGLPRVPKADREKAWQSARNVLRSAKSPKLERPDTPLEGSPKQESISMLYPSSLKEFVSEDTYVSEQMHKTLASTADVIPGMSRGMGHAVAALIETGEVGSKKFLEGLSKVTVGSWSDFLSKAAGRPMPESTRKVADLFIEASEAPFLNWTRKEKEYAAAALAERSRELGGKTGRVTSQMANVGYDTLQQLAVLRGANVRYGGGAGASGKVANAAKIAGYKYLTTEGDPRSNQPLWKQKMDAYGLTFAYMATPAISGFMKNKWVAKAADFGLNTLVSLKGGTYSDAMDASARSAEQKGFGESDVAFEKWLAAAEVAGMDGVFSALTTPHAPKNVSGAFDGAVRARNEAIDNVVKDLDDRSGHLKKLYDQSVKEADQHASEAREARRAGDVDGERTAIDAMKAARLETTQFADMIKGVDAERAQFSSMRESDLEPAPVNKPSPVGVTDVKLPDDELQRRIDEGNKVLQELQSEPKLSSESEREQVEWAREMVEKHISELESVRSEEAKPVKPEPPVKPVEPEPPAKPVEKPAEAPKPEALPSPKSTDDPVVAQTAPQVPVEPPKPRKPVEVRVESGEGARRVLRANTEDIPEGVRAESFTPQDMVQISGEFRVVSADAVKTSTEEGYDQTLQGRMRGMDGVKQTRGSQEQVEKIASGPIFQRLFRSPETIGGAPWIDDSAQTVSGNGRVEGLRRAYERGTAQAPVKVKGGRTVPSYESQVRAWAAKNGIDLTGVERPILVADLKDTGSETIERVAELSNRPQALGKTDVERAMEDAKTIERPEIRKLLDVSEDSGDVRSASNRAFIMRFIEETGEKGDLLTTNGQPNLKAYDRVETALLATILNQRDADGINLLKRSIENGEKLGIREQMSGIVQSGAKIMQLATDRPDMDFREDLGRAVQRLTEYKNAKLLGEMKSVEDMIAQQDLFDKATERQSVFLRELDRTKSAKQMREFIGRVIEVARKSERDDGSPKLFDTGPSTDRNDVLKKVQSESKGVSDERVPADDGRKVSKGVAGKDAKPGSTGVKQGASKGVSGTKPAPVSKVKGKKAGVTKRSDTKSEGKERISGTKAVAQRIANAENRFIEMAMDRGDLSSEQAKSALAEYKKAKVIKIDPVMGQFSLKAGGFSEKDVLRRAAGLEEKPDTTGRVQAKPKKTTGKGKGKRLSEKPTASNPLLEGTEGTRPKNPGETAKPQVAQENLLGGLTKSIAVGKAERAQSKMELDAPSRPAVKKPLANLSEAKQAKAARLQKELSEMKGRAGMGIDPEYLTKGTQLAALYIEGGVKTFEQFAINIKSDFGEKWNDVKEYLHAIWTGVGVDARDIDDITRKEAEAVIAKIDGVDNTPPPSPPAPRTDRGAETDGKGVSHAQIDKLREIRGYGERVAREGNSDKDIENRVSEMFRQDPNTGRDLVAALLSKDAPKTTDIDQAVLVFERVAAESALERALDAGDSKGIAIADKRLSELARVADKSGSELGAGLRARRFLLGDDFSNLRVMKHNLEKDQNGRPATPGQVAELAAMKRAYDNAARQRDEARQQAKEAQEKVSKDVQDREDAEAYRILVDEAVALQKNPPKLSGKMRALGERWQKEAEAELSEAFSRVSAGIDPTLVNKLAKWGAGKMLAGVADWMDLAVKIHGDVVRPYLKHAGVKARMLYEEAQEAGAQKSKGKKSKPATADRLLAKADTLPKKLRAVYKTIVERDVAETGEGRPFDDVTKEVQEYMLDVFGLDLTESRIRAEFSDYGKARQIERTTEDLVMSDYRRQAQLIESLELLNAGLRKVKDEGLSEFPKEFIPKKSGIVRPKRSDTVRDIEKEVRRLMKEADIQTTDPQKQLATARAAIKTRIENSIRDLRQAIETGVPKAGGEKNPTPYDDELMQLSRTERELREAYKEMFLPEKQPLSEKQRADIALKAAQRSLNEWDSILSDARKGVFHKRVKSQGYTNERIEGVKQARDVIKSEVKRLRDLAEPKMSPEERAVQSKKKRLQNAIKEVQRRIDEKDFSKRERKEVDISGDPEAMAAEKHLAEIRREYAIIKEDARRAQRGFREKAADTAVDLVDFVRYVKSTWDFSGILRQGGPVAASDPDVWVRSILPVAKAWLSKEAAAKDWERFTHRGNFDLYNQAKLGITPGDGMGGFGRIDDIRKSFVADRIPVVERSQRSFATTLNHLRANLFDKLLDASADPKDVSTEKLRDIARFVNTWTGRGDVNVGNKVNAVFWAPKFIKSAFDISTTKAIWDGKSGDVRKMASLRYAKALGMLSALYGTYAMVQQMNGEEFDVELNPTSSLFGSIRVGDYYINPIGYARPMLTFLARFSSGEFKTSSGNRYVMYRGFHPASSLEAALGSDAAKRRIEDGAPHWSSKAAAFETVGSFARSKMHPGLALAMEMLQGRDFVGNDISRAESLIRGLIPIVPQTIYDMMQTEDPDALAMLSVAAVLGVGPRKDYDAPAVVRAFSKGEDWQHKSASVLWTGSGNSADLQQRKRMDKYLAAMSAQEVVRNVRALGRKRGLRRSTVQARLDRLLTRRNYAKRTLAEK